MFHRPLTVDAQLRPLEPWLSAEFLEHLDRAREYISPWVSPSFVATDPASARVVLGRYAERWATDSGGIWGIWLDGRLVGGVLFVSFDAVRGVAEVGCWLEPKAQGRGLVTRAATVIIDWAVLERGVHRVEWRTDPRNTRSSSVARRLGMRLDGTLRQAFLGPDGRVDSEIWSVLADEWRVHRAGAASIG